MSGKLTDKFMDQLEQWIGTGPKKFDLLYAITRHGCNNTAFHKKCDNQGPTVTVLYNQQGSVYGGYTSLSWDQSGACGNDRSAFLFRLQSKGTAAANKFPCTNDTNSIYKNASYGPTFGGNYDLKTFTGTINNSGGYFVLNGSLNLGFSYNNQGIPNNQINDGNMYVTELEVYKVTDGQRPNSAPPKTKPFVLEVPWRKTPEWCAKSFEDLKSEVENFAPPRGVQVDHSKILVLGPVGAGKSSFFNTIASVFRGRVTRQASSGSAEHSITSQYRMYQVRSASSGQSLNFRLCDTRGIEENQSMDANDVNYLLEGNVPEGYQFNPSVSISSEILGFKRYPTLNDRIHCVCIVIDGSTAGVLPEKILEKIKAIQSKIYLKGIPQLTKVDKICSQVEGDVSKVFRSEAVLEQVNKVSQLLGVPRNNVFPIKNYETEIQLDENINILALIALTQILQASEDYLFNYLDDACRDSDNAPTLKSKD